MVQDGIYSERYYNNFSGNELINYGDIERVATQGYYNGDNYVSMNQHNDDKDYAFSGMFYTDSENGLALFPQNVGLSLFDCVPTDGNPHWYEIEKITGYDLYYCKIGRKSEPVKIYSDVERYQVTEDGKMAIFISDGDLFTYNFSSDKALRVGVNVSSGVIITDGSYIYYKTKDGKLYGSETVSDNLEAKSELIAEGVADNIFFDGYSVSDDGEYIAYSTSAGVFIKTEGKPAEKMCDDYATLEYTSEDNSIFYYSSNDSLYKYTLGGSSELIADNIESVLKAYETGEMYFTVFSDNALTLKDFVTDDMMDYDTQFEDEYYYNYYDFMEENNEVWRRMNVREKIEGDRRTSLWYYDGNTAKKIADSVLPGDYYNIYAADDTAEVIFSAYNGGTKNFKLSEIVDNYATCINIYESEMVLRNSLYDDIQSVYLAVGDQASEIGRGEIKNPTIADGGKSVYYIANIGDQADGVGRMEPTPGGNLFRLEIKNGTPGNAELYDTDVAALADYIGKGYYSPDVVYYKNYTQFEDQYSGDLYINKELVAYSTYAEFDSETGELYYYDDGKQVRRNGQPVKNPDNESASSYRIEEGSLYMGEDSDKILVDTDVSAVF